MASPTHTTSPGGFVRVESMRSNASSGQYNRAQSSVVDAMSDIVSFTSESPRTRFQGQLHDLAVAAGIPLALPKPMLSDPSQRATPQNPSDKVGAEAFLMSLRKKKFLVGKSSKGFANDEIMLGLDKAVKDGVSAQIMEALLQFAESGGITSATSSAAFTPGKKGHAIPTLDYVFGQTEHPKPLDVWRQFLGRVSQRALDNSLAGALKDRPNDVERIRALLEWGANPELCQDRILELVSSPGSEDTVETLLLSPSLKNPEFLNHALVQSASSSSLRKTTMLLLREADAGFSHGSAMKAAVTKKSYDISLAIALLSKRPMSSSILDDVIGVVSPWSQDVQKPFLMMLLYAGACGPRTSRIVSPYITGQDSDIIPFLVESQAFRHGSFPSSKLFQAAVESRDTALALSILRTSKHRSFSDYASTGAHLQLVESYKFGRAECLEIISELLTLGSGGDYSSQMLVKACESEQIQTPEILDLINLLIQTGGAKATYSEGKCLLLAIEAAQPAIVKALVSAQPTKKVLNTAIAHANSSLKDGDPAKLEIWTILLEEGALGQSVDQQLVAAVDKSPYAVDKVKLLLPAASLDYQQGEAIVKAIQLERIDILETCVGMKKPQSALPSIWKQTRRLFAIAGDFPYQATYVQRTFEILHSAGKHAAPLDDLLHDATQCRSKETALSLSLQLLRWGASPNPALGASLLACIKRSDAKTLAALLAHEPSKTSLKYAFEEALSLSRPARYEVLKMIIEAGLEKASLDAALPRILKEDPYESVTVHLFVQNGARLHSALGDNLIPPAKHLDLMIVEALIPKTGNKDGLLLPLQAVLRFNTDWQAPDGHSLQMVKLLLANSGKGTWADHVFITQIKAHNQHAATLFVGHLTSAQVVSDALHELLQQDKGNLSREKLSTTTYLFNHGARHSGVDGIFLRAAQTLNYEWVTVLNPHLHNPAVRLAAFEAVMKSDGDSLGGNKLEIVQFLLQQGVKGPAADEAFINCATTSDLKGMNHFLPFVSSKTAFSEALNGLSGKAGFASTNDGRAAVKLLIQNGASEASVQNCARAAARARSLDGIKLVVKGSHQHSANRAAFQGLMGIKNPLSSPESCAILSHLVDNGLDVENAKSVARLAASTHDVTLMKEIQPLDHSGEMCDVALDTVASSGQKWLSPEGLSFVEYLIARGAAGSTMLRMIETAAKSERILPALRLLLPTCGDRQHAASVAFASLASDHKASFSTERLAAVDYLLKEGAKGVAVEQLAAHAAETSNYDALDVFLSSPIAGSLIPVAFRAVARNKSKHLSSDQLSIASILVKHGVSTEVLAIAAVEASTLLDLEALKVLSKSPHFPAITDDTLRALLLRENLWRSPRGLRIMQYLFETGVSQPTTEAAATKAAVALDIDALRLVLDSNQSPETVEVSFASMIGLERAWLSPEGLRITELLLPMSPSQANIDKAFIQACQYLHHDAVLLLHPYIIDISVFNTALAKATSTEGEWFSELRVIEKLLDSGVEGVAIESALIKGAQALNRDCLKLLSTRVDRSEVYSSALAAAQTNKNWRQSLDVVEFLLSHGANGEPVDNAFISAAGSLDYRAASLLAGHVDNEDADCRGFTAATSNDTWLSAGHLDLLKLLYGRRMPLNVVKPALIAAAEAFNLPAVELLAQNANGNMASAAFASATATGKDWVSPEGTSVLEILAQKGAAGHSVEQALISSAQQLRLDLVKTLVPNIDKDNLQCFSSAFDAVVTTGHTWLSRPEPLDILQILIEKGASAQSAQNALVDAAQNGNLDAVNVLVQVVHDLDAYTEAFNTLTQSGTLWLEDDSHELLALLLSRGASGEGLHIALISAMQEVILGYASADLLTLLLSHGADVNYEDGRALQLASRSGRLDLFDLLLAYGPDSITLYMGLQEALCSEHEEELVLEFFISIVANDSLEMKPDVNHDSDLGRPLIFYCLMHYPFSVDLVKELCDCGADLTATISWTVYEDEPNFPPVLEDKITPLLFALQNNASDEVVLDVLLAYGAEHDYVPKHSQASALVLAAYNDRADILSTLIDRGARVAQLDCFKRTPLFYAARNGNTSALTSLLKKNLPTNDGSLHEAARELQSDALKMLVDAGHDINFPSLKHGGRSPLCELCYNCRGSDNSVGLQDTLSQIMACRGTPLRKYKGKTALFFAMENEDPVSVVFKLIEMCLWQDLNDPTNVIEEDSHFYSATMYIKKGICSQPENVAKQVLTVLQDASAEDRYYAKERMQQPQDAIGMPQRIADLDHKKWIRSNRLEEEQEDHQRRLRREMEEMAQRDQLAAKRHLLTMEHREDTARQTTNHTADAHWQGMQIRSREHGQTTRFKDDLFTHRLDEVAATHRLKYRLEQQVRGAQLQHESQTNEQKLGYLGREQDLKLDGAQANQQLRLEGISSEYTLKNEQQVEEIGFKAERSNIDRADMDYKLQHTMDMSSDRVQTQGHLEDIARGSQRERNVLDHESRQSQLEYQESHDDRRLQTEGGMNQFRRDNNDDTIRTRNALGQIETRTLHDKHEAIEHDRQNQFRFNVANDRQKLDTLSNTGRIQNTTLRDRHGLLENDRQNQLNFNISADRQKLETLESTGRIQNDSLYERGQIEHQTLHGKNILLQENRDNELQSTKNMGNQRILNERGMGQQRIQNERGMGHQRLQNETSLGQRRILNERGMGQQRIQNERGMGRQRIQNEHGLGRAKFGSERALGGARAHNAQMMNGLNRQKLMDNFQARRHMNNVGGPGHGRHIQ